VALKIERHTGKEDHINRLFQGLQDNISEWMSHGDKLSRLPDDFQPIASTINAPFAGIASISRPYFGLQFHPEVTTAPKILFNFAVEVYKARQEYDLHY
jgi:GMP synthase (glutamine-hydrolysing)